MPIFMDEARIEKLGARAIAPQLGDVRRANTRDQLAALMGRTMTDLEHSLFSLIIDVDVDVKGRWGMPSGQCTGPGETAGWSPYRKRRC